MENPPAGREAYARSNLLFLLFIFLSVQVGKQFSRAQTTVHEVCFSRSELTLLLPAPEYWNPQPSQGGGGRRPALGCSATLGKRGTYIHVSKAPGHSRPRALKPRRSLRCRGRRLVACWTAAPVLPLSETHSCPSLRASWFQIYFSHELEKLS